MDPAAEARIATLAVGAQSLRDGGQNLREQATEGRANAQILRGNLAVVDHHLGIAEGAVAAAGDHADYRATVLDQATAARGVSEERARQVAEGAPEYVSRAGRTHDDESGPMAGEANDMAGESRDNVPDDDDSADDAREQSGKLERVSSDSHTVDEAVGSTRRRAEGLADEAAEAQRGNLAAAGTQAGTAATIADTRAQLGTMQTQNADARRQQLALRAAPGRLADQATTLDAQGGRVIAASEQLEARLADAQRHHAQGMARVPAVPEPEPEELSGDLTATPEEVPAGPEEPVAEAEPTAAEPAPGEEAEGEEEARVDLVSHLPSWLSGQETPDEARRADMQRQERERREAELREIEVEAGGDVASLGAAHKVGIALRLAGRRLFGGISQISWPGWGGLASGAGNLALSLVDPRSLLVGVVDGLGRIFTGFANLRNFARDPLGVLLKSAADIATGLTIILGSITALAALVAAAMTALTIITLGAASPITGPIIAFCATVMTTVGGWTVSVGLVALELQAYVFIKNLIDAATATTAGELQRSSDHLAEDAGNAANIVLQIGMAKLAQVGGRGPADGHPRCGRGRRLRRSRRPRPFAPSCSRLAAYAACRAPRPARWAAACAGCPAHSGRRVASAAWPGGRCAHPGGRSARCVSLCRPGRPPARGCRADSCWARTSARDSPARVRRRVGR